MKDKKIRKIIILIAAVFLIAGCRKTAWKQMLDDLPDDRRNLINDLSCTYESTNYQDKINIIFYVKNDSLRLKTWLNNDSASDLDIIADSSDIGLSQSLKLIVDNTFLETFGNYFLNNNKCMNFTASEKNAKITLVSSGGGINFKLVEERTTPINTTPSAEVAKKFFNSYRGTEDVITFSILNGKKYVQVNNLSKLEVSTSDVEINDATYKYYISATDLPKIFVGSNVSSSFVLARDNTSDRFVITMDSSKYDVVYNNTGTETNNGNGTGTNTNPGDCTGILEGTYFSKILSNIFNVIRMAGVGLVFLMSILDFTGAVFAKDEDQIKKASEKAVKRLIIAILIFFLPMILNLLLSLIGGMGTICV